MKVQSLAEIKICKKC